MDYESGRGAIAPDYLMYTVNQILFDRKVLVKSPHLDKPSPGRCPESTIVQRLRGWPGFSPG